MTFNSFRMFRLVYNLFFIDERLILRKIGWLYGTGRLSYQVLDNVNVLFLAPEFAKYNWTNHKDTFI